MKNHQTTKSDILKVYDLWQANGKTPYEYLFLLNRDQLEIDYAVLRVGRQQEWDDLSPDERNAILKRNSKK